MQKQQSSSQFCISIAVLYFIAMPLQLQAAVPVSAPIAHPSDKERLVLMPLRLEDEAKKLQGAMDTALVEGLQQKYDVFSGEQVSQKAHEIFLKESRNAEQTECDETRCMQKIAGAFQAELIATANVTKQDGGYFLALSVQNIFDNKMVYSKSIACPRCTSFQVVDKLKELSGMQVVASDKENESAHLIADSRAEIAKFEAELKQLDAEAAATSNQARSQSEAAQQKLDLEIAKATIEGKLKSEHLKTVQLEAEQKQREAETIEHKRWLDEKEADDKRLELLKVQAEARRMNSVSHNPADFPTVESAVAEIQRLKERINTIESGYEKELAQIRQQVNLRYAAQFDVVDKEEKGEFETVAEFNAKQFNRRAELNHNREIELAKIPTMAEMAELETSPLRDGIKALSEREYIVGAENFNTEVGSYDAETQQFPIKVKSKSPAIQLALNGHIQVPIADAKSFKLNWTAGLVRLEAKVKPNSDLIELALVNDADNIRMTNEGGVFMTSAQKEERDKQAKIADEKRIKQQKEYERQNSLASTMHWSSYALIWVGILAGAGGNLFAAGVAFVGSLLLEPSELPSILMNTK